MRFIRTNLPPGVIAILIVLAILFAIFFALPILLIGGFCWLVCVAITGSSPLDLYLRRKTRLHSRFHEGPFEQDTDMRDDDAGTSAASDDTIECEVLSARTFDENGQEIR